MDAGASDAPRVVAMDVAPVLCPIFLVPNLARKHDCDVGICADGMVAPVDMACDVVPGRKVVAWVVEPDAEGRGGLVLSAGHADKYLNSCLNTLHTVLLPIFIQAPGSRYSSVFSGERSEIRPLVVL